MASVLAELVQASSIALCRGSAEKLVGGSGGVTSLVKHQLKLQLSLLPRVLSSMTLK